MFTNLTFLNRSLLHVLLGMIIVIYPFTCIEVQWSKTYGHNIVTQYQNRISDNEHSLNNALKIVLKEPFGACRLLFERMKFHVWGTVQLIHFWLRCVVYNGTYKWFFADCIVLRSCIVFTWVNVSTNMGGTPAIIRITLFRNNIRCFNWVS